MTTIATNKTGANSFSGLISIAGAVSGAASAVQAIASSGTDMHQAVFGGGGILLALGSVIAKLKHDQGIHIATIQQAGSDIAAQLPQIKVDLARTIDFIEHDVPGAHDVVTALQNGASALAARLSAVEAKAVPTITDIESTVRTVLTSILGATAQGAVATAPGIAPIQATTTETPVVVPATA